MIFTKSFTSKKTGSRKIAKRKGLWLLSMLALIALMLMACGGQGSQVPAPGQGQVEKGPSAGQVDKADKEVSPQKTELVLAIGGGDEDGFDPTTGWGRYGSPLFQSTLLTFDADLNIINDIATGYEVSEDSLVWTVGIREDIIFADGVELTASDVVYSFLTAKDSGSVVDLSVVESITALDNYTIEFRLKDQMSTFVNLLIATGIVPEHLHGDDYAQNPIGSGPYQLVQWDKGQQIIVEPNPHYYGNPVEFTRITFLILDESAALAAAQAGQVDIAAIPAAFTNQQVAGMDTISVQTVDNRGIMFPYVPVGGETADGVKIGNDVTSDLAIRQAINYAVDRGALVEGVLEGYGRPAYTIVDDLPWWNPDTVIVDNDMALAETILADAGWVMDKDGFLYKNGLKAEFDLVYPASDTTRQSLALATSDLIRPLGINIVPKGLSWDEIGKAMHSSAVLYGWGAHTPLEMYNIYSSKMQAVESYNPGFYKNDQVDEYLELAMRARTQEEANEYWKLAQWDGETGFSVQGDAVWAWLVNIDHIYLVNENLDIGKQRIQPHGHDLLLTANITEWRWK